jgi:hypothetical protein
MIKLKNIRRVGHEARIGEKRNAYEILIGKLEGNEAPGRSRHKWEDNINVDLKK